MRKFKGVITDGDVERYAGEGPLPAFAAELSNERHNNDETLKSTELACMQTYCPCPKAKQQDVIPRLRRLF